MNEQPKRKYQRISPEHLAYAKRRFGQEFASTSAVRAELKAMGAEYSHTALHHYWVKANPPASQHGLVTVCTGRSLTDQERALLNADPGDEQKEAA